MVEEPPKDVLHYWHHPLTLILRHPSLRRRSSKRISLCAELRDPVGLAELGNPLEQTLSTELGYREGLTLDTELGAEVPVGADGDALGVHLGEAVL